MACRNHIPDCLRRAQKCLKIPRSWVTEGNNSSISLNTKGKITLPKVA